MLSTRFTKFIKGFVLVSTMVFGVILVSSSSVSAQNRGYDDDRYYRNDDDRYNGRDRNGNQSVRFAYKKGYQDGLRQGRQDARNGQYGGYGNYGTYNTDPYGNYGNNGRYGNGNRIGWGNNSYWQQAYKSGFNRGYQDGFNRGRRNNGNGRVIRLPF